MSQIYEKIASFYHDPQLSNIKIRKKNCEGVHQKMLSKIKNLPSISESNTGNTRRDLENSKDVNDVRLFKNVFFDAAQVEEFLTSEYFSTEECLTLGCWENCSTYNNDQDASNGSINRSAESRPITALALMLLGQHSSLPRSNRSG